jgi:hypothetical protein
MPRKNIPKALRRFIQELRTNLDPAGTTRENVRLRRESEVLRKECKEVFLKGGGRNRPDPAMVKVLLAEAERNVAACNEIVERQRSIIKEMERGGQDLSPARSVLNALLNTQSLNVLTRDRLLGMLTE